MTEQQNPSKIPDPIPTAMTLQEAKDLIREKLNLIIGENDPVMFSVVLEQAFHSSREDQFKGHLAELSRIIGESSTRTVNAVDESLSLLKDDALKGSLENTLAAVSQKAKENDRVVQNIRAHGRAMWVATGLIWLAVVALFFILK